MITTSRENLSSLCCGSGVSGGGGSVGGCGCSLQYSFSFFS